jgi:hypothetical protein
MENIKLKIVSQERNNTFLLDMDKMFSMLSFFVFKKSREKVWPMSACPSQ